MAYKNGVGFEGARLEIFYPERADAVNPPYTEFIGKPQTFALVFFSDHAELYAHDGYTPGGWLIAGTNVVMGAYKDCDGVDLPEEAQLVQCSDILSYALAALNNGAQVSTVTAGNSVTFKVGAKVDVDETNFLSLSTAGLLVNLLGCDGLPLSPTDKLALCDATITRGELDYEISSGTTNPELNEATGLATTDGPHFSWAVLRFYNDSDDEVFFIDITDALNTIDFAVDVSAEADNAVQMLADGIYVPTVSPDGGDTVSSADNAINVDRTGTDVALSLSVSAEADNAIIINSDGVYAPVQRNTPLYLEVTGDTTLTEAFIAADGYSGLVVSVNSATDVTLTVPTNIEAGRSFAIRRGGAGQINIGSDGVYTQIVNVADGFEATPRAQYSWVTMFCTAQGSGTSNSTWDMIGDLTQIGA